MKLYLKLPEKKEQQPTKVFLKVCLICSNKIKDLFLCKILKNPLRKFLYDSDSLRQNGTLFQRSGHLYFNDCLITFNRQNDGKNLD